MLTPDLMELPIDIIGGYVPAIPPSELPPGASPMCQDAEFPETSVATRGGLKNAFPVGSPVPNNASINGLKSYLTPSLQKRLLAWDSLGNFYKETPQGILNLIASRPYTNLFYRSTTLFGREYQGFFDSMGGFDIPRQYDDTNWDRVSQCGPGSAPTVVDSGTAGSITAGLRNVSVCFITRQSFITQAAVPSSWTAAGGKKASVTNIATGPPNVVARLLLFTATITAPATAGPFFSLPAGSSAVTTSVMLINDNVTTALTVDFTDAILISGFAANYLLTQMELGEVSGLTGYNSRLVGWGERSKLINVVNTTFDGGFSAANIPLGWTPDPAFSGGAGSALAAGLTADWGDALAITGDGATAIRGKITQSAFQDYLGVQIIGRNTGYSVRARIAKTAGLVAGTLHINLASPSGGTVTVGLAVSAAQAGLAYAEFTATITDVPFMVPPPDLLLQVYADGTPTNLQSFLVDSIEIFQTTSPFNYSTVRFSYAFNPEGFGSVTGQVQIRPSDGQQIRACFPIRRSLYIAKDHSLWYTTDDGVNEPASWTNTEVSSTVGICGANAVDWTEEWAVFAERSGLYITWGSDPAKISQEIQEDASRTGKIVWNSINWQYGHTVWVRIDQVNKRILVGAPVNGATSPNVVFVLDYKWLSGPQDIAQAELAVYSAFTGKPLTHGRGRRWVPWNITANSMTFAERADGTLQPFYGNGVANGKIYQQMPIGQQLTDDGTVINFIFQTYFAPAPMEEQGMQLGSSRKLLGYLKFRAIGAGTMQISVQTSTRTTNLRSYALSMTPFRDGGRPLQIHSERMSVIFRTSDELSWAQLEKMIPAVKKDAIMLSEATGP